MSVSSMTGFSRIEGKGDGAVWSWEVKSVNSKGLDIRCRLPGGFDRLDRLVRERIQKSLTRGSIFANLNLVQDVSQGTWRVNTAVLDAAMAAIPAVMERFPDATPPSVDGLLSLRGVLEPVDQEDNPDTRSVLDEALLLGLDRALETLLESRALEGARLKDMLDGHIATLESLHTEALTCAETQTGLMSQRIELGVAALLDKTPALSEDRLAQEAAVLCTKADVREELDRLGAHCEAAHDLLSQDGAIGRKFDFLCQEFNREANTLCSKAIDPGLTRVGLDMKVTIDQLREQVQNVE